MAQKNLTLNIGARTTELNAALGKMRKDIRSSTGNVTAMMQSAGMQMTAALTAPLALFGKSAIKNFASFEQSMAKVKAVSGATKYEFQELEANARELGASTRFTSQEVAGLQLEYSKLGFSSDELLKVTGATLALAQATDSDLSQAASVAGATLRAFQLDASDTGRMVDVMAASFSSTALDINAFSDSMKYVAPVANAAGVSLEQTTAMLGVLANAGIKGSQAGTALRRIFTEMADTGLPAADAIKKLAAEGIQLADAKDEVGRNAMSALLVLTKFPDKIDELTASLENSNGAAKKMAGVMDDTLEGSFKKMSSAFEAVSISFGDTFAPVVRGVADAMAILASAFSSLPGPVKAVLGVLAVLTAAAGPLLLLSPQLLAARASLLALRAAMAQTQAAALLLNPYFPLMLVGVTALAAGYYVLNKRQWRAKEVNEKLAASLDKARRAHKKLGDEMRGQVAETSTEDLQKRLKELEADMKATGQTTEVAAEGFDIYARINGEAAEQINAAKGAIERQRGATRDQREETAKLAKLEHERSIILAELQARIQEKTDDEEDSTEAVEALTAAQIRLNAAMKAGEKLGLDPDKLNVGGLLAKLGEGADAGGSSIFAAQFTLSDEQIAEADERTTQVVDSAKQKLESFRQSVQGFGMSLAGTFQGIFQALNEGSKSFGQIMGEILKQLLVKLISMAAAFAAISVLFGPAAAGSFGNFMKGGLGIPQMASGGIVSGPSIVEVGEYAGARSNPEIIAPLSKLKNLIGGGSLSARISGRDILLASSRDSSSARRQFTSTLI